jgi:hypothetical protein
MGARLVRSKWPCVVKAATASDTPCWVIAIKRPTTSDREHDYLQEYLREEALIYRD